MTPSTLQTDSSESSNNDLLLNFVNHPLRPQAISLFGKHIKYFAPVSRGGLQLEHIGIVFGVDPRPLGFADGCWLAIRPDGEIHTTHYINLEEALSNPLRPIKIL